MSGYYPDAMDKTEGRMISDAMDKTGGRMTSDGMDDGEIREHGRDDADLSSRGRSINNQRTTNE